MRVIAVIPNGAKFMTDKIMNMSEGQNGEYEFSVWRILKRVNRNTAALLVWAVDVKSAEELERNNCKLWFGFGYITIRQKTDEQTTVEKLIEELDSLEVSPISVKDE